MSDSTGITPRIIYFKYPKIKNSIKNITEEIDCRLNEIHKHRDIIADICPLPKRKRRFNDENKSRNQSPNKTRRKNFLPTFTITSNINNRLPHYSRTETIKSYSNQKTLSKPPLNCNNSNLFKLQRNISFFNTKRAIPFTCTETNETSRQYNNSKETISNENSPIMKHKTSTKLQVSPINNNQVKRVRPFSCKASIITQKKIIKSCSQIYEDTQLLRKEIIKEMNSKENKSKYRSSSLNNPNVLNMHKDLPFHKFHTSHHIGKLKHYMSRQKGYEIKDTLVKFKHIAKISPNESYKMRDMLGEEIGVSVKMTEDGVDFIKKDSLRERYQKPKWVDITDKKGREHFNAILRQIETNKRKIATVLDKYNLTDCE